MNMYRSFGLALVISFGLLSFALAGQEPPAANTPQATPPPAGGPTDPATTAPASSTAAAPAAETSASESKPAASANGKAPYNITADTAQGKQLVLKAGDPAAAMELKKLAAAGYKPEMHGTEIYFCRKEQLLGSRFAKKICNTADELDRITQDSQDEMDRMVRRGSISPSGT